MATKEYNQEANSYNNKMEDQANKYKDLIIPSEVIIMIYKTIKLDIQSQNHL